VPDLLDHETADFLRRLAPRDLDGVPLYVVNASALPPDRGGSLAYAGVTAATLDLELKDLIGREWAGRGACLVVNDGHAREVCTGAGAADLFVRSVAVHELAHVLGRRTLTAPLPRMKPARLRQYAVEMAARDATPPTDAADRPALPPPLMHGPQFMRLAMHLWRRAGGWKSYLDPRLINGGYQRPGYSGDRAVLDALGAEPEVMRMAPLAEVLALPLPPALTALWRRDAGIADAVPLDYGVRA
jgi:hypothetical protein